MFQVYRIREGFFDFRFKSCRFGFWFSGGEGCVVFWKREMEHGLVRFQGLYIWVQGFWDFRINVVVFEALVCRCRCRFRFGLVWI